MSDDLNSNEELAVGIRDKLNTEAGKLEWHELERFFAKGAVIRVHASLDLIDVAASMVEDEAAKITDWKEQGLIGSPADKEVIVWVEAKPLFWAVVIAPWIVVQEISSE